MITGTNRGLGLEMVWHLVQEKKGPKVIATCRNPTAAETLNRIKGEHPKRLSVFPMDVKDPDSVGKAYRSIAEEVDQLDWLVNNAGIGGFQDLEETTPGELKEVFEVNAVGPFVVTRTFRPLLQAAEAPMVFMVSSRMGSLDYAAEGGLNSFAYPVSKAAMNMVGLQLAKFLEPDGIGVVMQTPGWVQTDMGGSEAKYTPTESISKVLKVWKAANLKDSRKFFGENGETVAW